MVDTYLRYVAYCFRDVPTSLIVGMSLFFCVGTVLLLALMGREKGLKWTVGLMFFEKNLEI